MSVAVPRFDRESGIGSAESSAEGASSGINVLCVAFDQKSARISVPTAADHARRLRGRLLVLTAYTSAYSCAGPLVTYWGLPAIDPDIVARSEIVELIGAHGAFFSTVRVPNWRHTPAVVAAVLGEGSYAAAYVAPAGGRRGRREGRRTLEVAERYCSAVELRASGGRRAIRDAFKPQTRGRLRSR